MRPSAVEGIIVDTFARFRGDTLLKKKILSRSEDLPVARARPGERLPPAQRQIAELQRGPPCAAAAATSRCTARNSISETERNSDD
jgi:hypothetical protein